MNIEENSRSEYPAERVEMDILELAQEMRRLGYVVSLDFSSVEGCITVFYWNNRKEWDAYLNDTEDTIEAGKFAAYHGDYTHIVNGMEKAIAARKTPSDEIPF